MDAVRETYTADIKDFYINVNGEVKPLLAVIAQLIRRCVEVRLIHAKEPGQNFREDFDKYLTVFDRLERVLYPRVYFKIIVFDCKEIYIGCANMTGAGLGMKASSTRSFEAGILTDDPKIVDATLRSSTRCGAAANASGANAVSSAATR